MDPILILQILTALPVLITSIEKLVTAVKQGSKKREAVIEAVTPMIPVEHREATIPLVHSWIATLVSMYNLLGLFKKGT